MKGKQTKQSNQTQIHISVYICPSTLNTFVPLLAFSGSSMHVSVCLWVPQSARFARLARAYVTYFLWNFMQFAPHTVTETKMPTTVRTTDRVPIILTKMPTTMQENTNEYTFLEPYQLFANMCICIIFGTLSVVRIYVYMHSF